MKLSARNQFPGKVVAVNEGAVNAIVKLQLSGGQVISSTISLEAVRELELIPGKDAVAVIKATSVLIGKGELNLSARNKLTGKVISINEGAVNAIVKIQLPCGTIVSSTISLEAVNDLDLSIGTEATAIIKATEVLLMA